jgi:hypothetical protein
LRSTRTRPSGRGKEEHRADIRKERWEAVKNEAFVRVGYERNAERLLAELACRDGAAAMRTYADEIDARAAALKAPGRAGGTRVGQVHEHAERTDPLNGPLRLEKVTSCSHEELQPHMHGWSTYGPCRR